MFGSIILMSVALAGSTAVELSATRPEPIDVGYEDLRAGSAEAAIQRIQSNRLLPADDPSALINLGAAHARVGNLEEAHSYYIAAIASRDRYDVQLGDGRWMDTRRAARMAIELQQRGTILALK